MGQKGGGKSEKLILHRSDASDGCFTGGERDKSGTAPLPVWGEFPQAQLIAVRHFDIGGERVCQVKMGVRGEVNPLVGKNFLQHFFPGRFCARQHVSGRAGVADPFDFQRARREVPGRIGNSGDRPRATTAWSLHEPGS